MLAIEFKFLAGRYHANPWGRNVNEGDVEWPLSSYRLARALVDVWKRRRPQWPDQRILPILKALSVPPLYYLPSASAAHSRSFLASNEKDPTKKQLIFDAFVIIGRDKKAAMGLDCELSSKSIEDLDALLSEMNYLGRSESWIQAGVSMDAADYDWNCCPAGDDQSKLPGETIQMACLKSYADYENSTHKVDSTPWLDAICMSTKKLLSEGWNNPPAMQWIDYKRREDALRPNPTKQPVPLKAKFCCAKYALYSQVLPRVQDTVPFAERIRSHLMGIHKRIMGDDPVAVSKLFSGKEADGTPLKGHQHAFIQPLDEDNDGRLDHLLVYADKAFNHSELNTLDRLRSVWQPDRRPDVKLVLTSLSSEIPKQESKKWVSVTPFVTSRHYRKGRGTFDQWLSSEISKECSFHGLPEPVEIKWISHTLSSWKPLRWAEFVRSRKKSKPLRGYGCILEFKKAVSGPFSIGSACHYGLGLFMPHVQN